MQFSPLLAADLEWTPERFGEAIGAAVAMLLMVIGILKCIQIMRRPTTSKLCVSALLLVLIGWFISACGNTVRVFLVERSFPLIMLSSLLVAACMVAGLLLGILGLSLYDRSRFVQGRAQAIWGVCLGGVFSLLVFGVIIYGATMAVDRGDAGGDFATSGDSGGTIEKPEFNFSIKPSSRWVNMRVGSPNKAACLAMRRSNPAVYFMVIGEQLAGDVELDELSDGSKANLASAGQVLEQKEERVIVNGRPFNHIVSRVRVDAMNMTLNYEHWIATERGFAWQCVFWGDVTRTALTAEARAVVDTFKVLDPTRRGGGKGSLADVSRPQLGYATKLAGMGWNSWPDPQQLNALTDFSAQRLNEGLLVLPLRFDSQEPPDMDALAQALLRTLDFNYPADGDFDGKPWAPGHGRGGTEFTAQREIEGENYQYILRVARGQRSAHLLAGWGTEGKGDMAFVRQSLDAITLHEPTGSPPPLTSVRKTALGYVLNDVGLSYYARKEYAEAVPWFTRAFEYDPGSGVILENIGNAHLYQEKFAEGRDLLAPHVGRFPKEFNLGQCFAQLQASAGDLEAGNVTFLSLIARGMKDENGLLSWINLLSAEERYPEAQKVTEAWIAKHPTTNSRRWHANVLFLSGKQPEAVAVLEKLMAENPKDMKVAYDLGSYYNELGENLKAAAVAEKILADGKEAPPALVILGWSQMGRKWYRDAKSTFERAAKKSPDDPGIQDAIRQASALLGQGDNSSLREPIDLVPIPDEVASALRAQEPPADFGKGHPCAWLLRATGWHFEKGKPLRKTVHRRVKVLTTEGARELSSVEVPFDPLSERVYTNRLEVIDAEGKTVTTANVSDAYVRDLDDGTANHQKVMHLQVAGVQPGHIVEWEITFEDRTDADTFDFQRHYFANPLPSAAEAVFVTGDVSEVKSAVAQGDGLKPVKSGKLLAWTASTQPPAPDEPFAVSLDRRCPMLWLGNDEGGWEKVARDYLEQIEDRLKPEKPVADLATKLTDGLATPAEKIAAIARHVQKEYGYKAIEFGVRARRPNAASETVKLRYGDCKDFSLLLHQLLRAAGVESQLTLVDTRWRLQPAMPSLDQFNHMVVHVPVLGEGWLLDATDKTLDLAHHRAGGLWHAHALVLDPEKPRLLPPPTVPAGSCDVVSKRDITPDGNDWRVKETLTLNGYFSSSMREVFVGLNDDEQSQKAQIILATQGAAQLEDFRFEHLDDPAQPAVLHFAYKLRNAIGAGRAVPVPALWERYYLQTTFVKDRRTAFEQLYPMHLTSEVSVKLPGAPTPDSLEAMKQEGKSDFCAWKLESVPPSSAGKESVGLRFEFTTKPGEHPANRYSASHDAWEAARSAWERQLSWTAK